MMLTSILLLAVISSCMGSPQETVKESIVGEEDTLMRRTGLGHHGYGGGTSCLVKGSYCRLISLPLLRQIQRHNCSPQLPLLQMWARKHPLPCRYSRTIWGGNYFKDIWGDKYFDSNFKFISGEKMLFRKILQGRGSKVLASTTAMAGELNF